MNLEPEAPSNILLCLKIILIFGLPVFVLYWINSVIFAKAAKPTSTSIPTFYKYSPPVRFKPKTLRYCEKHLTSIPKGRIVLVVETVKCDLCQSVRR